MKKLLGTTAIGLALAVSPAMAGDQTDVNQVMNIVAPQDADNEAFGFNLLNVDQLASNLGNYVDNVGNYDDIDQFIGVPQSADNLMDIEGNSVDTSTQAASNSANVVDIIDGTTGDVNALTQTVNFGGDIQSASNRLETNDEGGGQGNVVVDDFEQTASNTGNYANVDDVFEFATQAFANPDDNQVASNFIGGDVGSNDPNVESQLNNVEQSASNGANILLADDFRDGATGFLQSIGQTVDQTATNTAWFELGVTDTDQSASNTANYADVNGVDGKATQNTGEQADQVARNRLLREDADDDGLGSVLGSSQTASNYANIFKSVIEIGGDRPEQDKGGNQTPDPDVDQLVQYGGDSQRATNQLSFGDRLGEDTTGPNKFNSSQDATNIMNLAEVENLSGDGLGGGDTIALQTAAGVGNDGEPAEQLATNNAFFEGSGTERGHVTDFGQGATNLANVMYAGNLPSLSATEFSQSLSLPQTAMNSIDTIGNLTEVSQSSSNVGNVISGLDD